jgi:hypothetical protein
LVGVDSAQYIIGDVLTHAQNHRKAKYGKQRDTQSHGIEQKQTVCKHGGGNDIIYGHW